MKKSTIFAATMLILLAMVSCSRAEMETTELQGDDATMKPQASARFIKAMQTARDAAGLLDGEPATRSEQERQIDESEVKFVIADNATRSESESDTLMYVFNYMDNAGFAVVSAVGESGEMLAVTEQGHFSSMEEIENEGFRIFMEAATVYTDSLLWAEKESTRGGGQTGPEIIILDSVAIDTTIITYGTPVTVRWGQSVPYNMFCPYDGLTQCPAGCVAIAIGQILSVHEYPTSWTLTYESGNPTINVNWSVLKNQASCTSCTTYTFCSVHTPIAQIIRQIGKKVFMNYEAGGSSSNIYYANLALILMGYSTGGMQNYGSGGLFESIQNGRPVYMQGGRTYVEGGVTKEAHHAWVIDRYRIIEYTFHEYSKPQNKLSWTYQGSHTYEEDYYHINWGWRGDCDGYYRVGVFNTASGIYDPGCSHDRNRNYTFDLKTIPNIHR